MPALRTSAIKRSAQGPPQLIMYGKTAAKTGCHAATTLTHRRRGRHLAGWCCAKKRMSTTRCIANQLEEKAESCNCCTCPGVVVGEVAESRFRSAVGVI